MKKQFDVYVPKEEITLITGRKYGVEILNNLYSVRQIKTWYKPEPRIINLKHYEKRNSMQML
jgi:hypothetical protein